MNRGGDTMAGIKNDLLFVEIREGDSNEARN